jgi:hypothetical protein
MEQENKGGMTAAERWLPLLKVTAIACQGVATAVLAIWYASGWAAKVDLRLDDIDRDLKTIHERQDRQEHLRGFPEYSPGVYKLPRRHIRIDTPNGAA